MIPEAVHRLAGAARHARTAGRWKRRIERRRQRRGHARSAQYSESAGARRRAARRHSHARRVRSAGDARAAGDPLRQRLDPRRLGARRRAGRLADHAGWPALVAEGDGDERRCRRDAARVELRRRSSRRSTARSTAISRGRAASTATCSIALQARSACVPRTVSSSTVQPGAGRVLGSVQRRGAAAAAGARFQRSDGEGPRVRQRARRFRAARRQCVHQQSAAARPGCGDRHCRPHRTRVARLRSDRSRDGQSRRVAAGRWRARRRSGGRRGAAAVLAGLQGAAQGHHARLLSDHRTLGRIPTVERVDASADQSLASNRAAS